MSQRQIILDTETTGLYPENGDRLVEFAGLEMINRQMTDSNLHLYVHPERDMPEEAAKVTWFDELKYWKRRMHRRLLKWVNRLPTLSVAQS